MRFFKNYTYLAIVILAIIVLAQSGIFLYIKFFGRFDIQHVKAVENFEYKDNLSCDVVYSTYQHIGESTFKFLEDTTIDFKSLHSENPQLEFDTYTQQLKKVYEDDRVVILNTQPKDAFFETLEVSKIKGTFTQTIMMDGQYFGSREILHPEGFQYVAAQKGRCE